MDNDQNNWTQGANEDSQIREGQSSLDQSNMGNEKREQGDWNDARRKGTGDYGSEEGRSDAGVTGGETDISRPFSGKEEQSSDNNYGNIGRQGGVEEEADKQEDNDQWSAQHPGELPV